MNGVGRRRPQRAARSRDRLVQPLATWLIVIAMGASVSGCASGSEGSSETNAAAVARGEALAQRACSSCHGMGPTGASARAEAPPFRDLRFDLNAISNERSLAKMHQGRVSMPPAEISLEDVRDIGAYAASLRPDPRAPKAGGS